jgi:hypothetical protein
VSVALVMPQPLLTQLLNAIVVEDVMRLGLTSACPVIVCGQQLMKPISHTAQYTVESNSLVNVASTRSTSHPRAVPDHTTGPPMGGGGAGGPW